MITFKKFLNEVASNQSYGVNPVIYPYFNNIKAKYTGVTNMGIWGDAAHQRRKSDHNTGDAIDIGITSIGQGNSIANETITGNNTQGSPIFGHVKYVIFNRQIWNPTQGWHSYTGQSPHTDHVHVSFLRTSAGPAKDSSQLPPAPESNNIQTQQTPGQQQTGTESMPPTNPLDPLQAGQAALQGVYDLWNKLGTQS